MKKLYRYIMKLQESVLALIEYVRGIVEDGTEGEEEVK